MEDEREWEKARQVVEAIAKIMVGGGEEPTPENPVVSSTSLSGSGPVKTEVKVKKVLNVDYEQRVKDLTEQKRKVDIDGAAAVERLRKKWAEEEHG